LILALQKHAVHNAITSLICLEYNRKLYYLALQVQECFHRSIFVNILNEFLFQRGGLGERCK